MDNLEFNKTDKSEKKFDLYILEEKLMISPIKKLMQSQFEMRVFNWFLKTINVKLSKISILEVGCGAGYGIEQISKQFNPKEYYAFDINSKMLALSKAKIQRKNLSVRLFLSDVRYINLPSNKFDFIFVFTVFHHVENWLRGLKEVNRIMKPNGLLFINEISKRSLDWFERYLKVHHPKNSRFTWPIFKKGLSKAGFSILREFRFLGDFGFFLCVKNKNSDQ